MLYQQWPELWFVMVCKNCRSVFWLFVVLCCISFRVHINTVINSNDVLTAIVIWVQYQLISQLEMQINLDKCCFSVLFPIKHNIMCCIIFTDLCMSSYPNLQINVCNSSAIYLLLSWLYRAISMTINCRPMQKSVATILTMISCLYNG